MNDEFPWPARAGGAREASRPLADDITLVIPTLGRPIIRQCLSAILAGSMWPRAIIVVDQGNSRQIADWLRGLRELGIDGRHEPCAGRGRALGLNIGLRLASTDCVVVTDDDCVPDARWIERYAAHLAHRPDAVFTGQVAAAGEERVVSTVSDPEPSTSTRPGWSFDRLSGGNCGMAVRLLHKSGLFDEDPCMRFAEDGEWAYRVLKAGIPIVYAPDLIVSHIGWRGQSERLAQYRGYARSQGAFFGKHLRRGDLFMIVRAGVHFARSLRRWARGSLRGDLDLAANGRSYATQLLPGIAAGLKSGVRPPSI